jgi:hypothetical protein
VNEQQKRASGQRNEVPPRQSGAGRNEPPAASPAAPWLLLSPRTLAPLAALPWVPLYLRCARQPVSRQVSDPPHWLPAGPPRRQQALAKRSTHPLMTPPFWLTLS